MYRNRNSNINILRITSTSFLLPSLPAWDSLKSKIKIDFGEYGDWNQALFNSYETDLVWVVFIDDVFNDNEISNEQKIVDWVEHFLIPLRERLIFSKFITIALFSFFQKESIIRNSKSVHIRKLLRNIFKDKLYELASKFPLLYLVDLDDLFSYEGFQKCLSSRNYYAVRSRLASSGLNILADSIENIFSSINNNPKKVIALDCDNTLWGGVVGEIGVSGILLGTDGIGKAYVDFQKSIKKLVADGFILIILSKNNEHEVWNVFEHHNSMILRKEDIISSRINWNEKSQNLIEISSDLDLGLESFVFWDDNPVEREKMKIALPMVYTVDVPDAVTEWPSYILALDQLAKFKITSEDNQKNEQYRSRAAFINDKKTEKNIKSFLRSIDMQPEIDLLSDDTLNRAEQLCMKTNQFNLRTIRYNAKEIVEISTIGNVYTIKLKDRYGDHGIIGLVMLLPISNEIMFLNTFLLSCRVLGRCLESWIMNWVIGVLKNKNQKVLLTSYIPSGKNEVVLDFLAQNCFDQCANDDLLIQYYYDNSGNPLYREVSNEIFYKIDVDTVLLPNLDIFN
jgi:FkbH-like protein